MESQIKKKRSKRKKKMSTKTRRPGNSEDGERPRRPRWPSVAAGGTHAFAPCEPVSLPPPGWGSGSLLPSGLCCKHPAQSTLDTFSCDSRHRGRVSSTQMIVSEENYRRTHYRSSQSSRASPSPGYYRWETTLNQFHKKEKDCYETDTAPLTTVRGLAITLTLTTKRK